MHDLVLRNTLASQRSIEPLLHCELLCDGLRCTCAYTGLSQRISHERRMDSDDPRILALRMLYSSVRYNGDGSVRLRCRFRPGLIGLRGIRIQICASNSRCKFLLKRPSLMP